MRNLFLISYDIVERGNRRRVLKAVKGNAIGGQKSVYECWLNEDERQEAGHAISAQLQDAADRVMLIRLDPRAAMHMLGVAVKPDDGEIFYQG